MPSSLEDLRAALKGRYEIDREIGQGGMATVYLADDLRHQRKVAVKVLRPDLAAALGGERFLREIRIAANLTHPHILPLYDSGEADGFLYYVMPYIKGDTLRERLDKEVELPVAEAVRIIREVVDALAFAHSQGVVHRDIKPDNVMLSGRHAMVMDFGVAKAVSEATGASTLTTAGVALGTPSYMAPEQATADPHVDHRADIYAVGVMAYELLAGRTPFRGGSPQAVLAAHVTEQPDPVSKHRDHVSGDLEALVMKCLAKKPADRWQSAEEMLPHLEAMAATSGGLTPTSTRPIHGVAASRRRVWWMAAGAAAAVVVIAVFGATLLRDDPIVITASNITHVTSEPGVEFEPAISPDGSEVAYVGGPITNPRLVVRSTVDVGGGGESRPGEGVGGSHWFPSWTPDGASIRFLACQGGFGSGCDWKEVGSRGGAVRALAVPRVSAELARYAWSGDGTRVAFGVGDSIFAYAADRGEPELLAVKSGGIGPHSLVWSPDGRWIAFVSGNFGWRIGANVGPASIWMVAADGGEPIPVTDDGPLSVSPQWLSDSRHLLFVSDRDGPRGIYVVEVGPEGPRGPPRSVLGSSDPHSIAIAADGRRLAYSKFTVAQNIWSIAIPRSGAVSIRDAVPVTTGNQVIEEHALSPDGEWIVFGSDIRGGFNVYKQRVAGGPTQLLATISGHANAPKWSPDGAEIAFQEDPGGILVVPGDGGSPEQLSDSTVHGGLPQWSPDGLTIAFVAFDGTGPGGVSNWTVSRDSVGMPWSAPVQLTRDLRCRVQDWAPDGSGALCLGREIVQLSREGEILWRYQLSTAGLGRSIRAKFSRDGTRIYFLAMHEDGSQGVWWIPAGGGDATKVVAFDDPDLEVLPFALSVGPEHLYLTIGEYESDIWAMDLEY